MIDTLRLKYHQPVDANKLLDKIIDTGMPLILINYVEPLAPLRIKREAQNNGGVTDEPPNNPKPTDDDLADRWLAQHPLTAYGLGEFRRYENGIWPVIDLYATRNEILDILQQAKAEGIRPSKPLLNSVVEIAA